MAPSTEIQALIAKMKRYVWRDGRAAVPQMLEVGIPHGAATPVQPHEVCWLKERVTIYLTDRS